MKTNRGKAYGALLHLDVDGVFRNNFSRHGFYRMEDGLPGDAENPRAQIEGIITLLQTCVMIQRLWRIYWLI